MLMCGLSGASGARMVLLESEQFLTELTRLFQKCRLSGSVFITLKKCEQPAGREGAGPSGAPAWCPMSGNPESAPVPFPPAPTSLPCPGPFRAEGPKTIGGGGGGGGAGGCGPQRLATLAGPGYRGARMSRLFSLSRIPNPPLIAGIASRFPGFGQT